MSVASTRSDISWCTVSPLSGSAGQGTIKISATANDDYDDRSVTLTIKSGTASKTLVVNQKQLDALTLTTSKFVVDSDGSDINVEVKANIDFTVKVDDKCKDWIHLDEGSSRGLASTNLRFTIDPNWEFDKREGEITVQSGELMETLTVYQRDLGVLLLSSNEMTVSAKGGELRVELNNEMEFSAGQPSADWIELAPETRNMSSHTLVYSFQPNTTGSARQAQIVFTATNSYKSETLTVTQVPEGYFETELQELEVDNWGEPYQILVKTCEDYTVSAPSWANVKSKTAPDDKAESVLTLMFETNSSGKSRTGTLKLTNKQSNKTESIQITQPEHYLKGKDELSTPVEESTVIYEVEANAPYSMTIGGYPGKEENESKIYDKAPQWIHYVGREATSDPYVFHEVFRVESYDKLTELYHALITFTSERLTKQVTVRHSRTGYITITPQTEWHVNCEGGTFEVTLVREKNKKIDYDVPPSDKSLWVSFEREGANESSLTEKVTYTVSPNNSPEPREGFSYIRSGNLALKITIQQDGTETSFVRSGAEVYVGSWEQTIPIGLNRSDYTVEIAGNPSWLSVGEKKEGVDRCTQEFVVKANTTGQNRNAKITFRSGSKVQEVNFTQLIQANLPKIEVDAAWKDYPISSLEYNVYSNSAGAYLFNALVPEPIDFIDTMYRKVLSKLYLSPTDASIPVLPQTYVFEIRENETGWGGSKNSKTTFVDAQKLETWYKEGGTEKMMEELQNHFISAMVRQFMIENSDIDIFTFNDAIKLLDSTEGIPTWVAYSNYNYQRAAPYFFRWLTLNKDRDFLRKLNASSLYVKPWSLERAFKYALGKQYDIDELWDEFVKTIKQ